MSKFNESVNHKLRWQKKPTFSVLEKSLINIYFGPITWLVSMCCYFSYNFTLSMANNNGKLLNIWLNILEKNMFLQIIK